MLAFLSPALYAGCSPKASGNNTDGIPRRLCRFTRSFASGKKNIFNVFFWD
jgi:hypothetical protein